MIEVRQGLMMIAAVVAASIVCNAVEDRLFPPAQVERDSDAHSLVNRAVSYMRAGNLEAAERDMLEAFSLGAGWAAAHWYNAGVLSCKKREWAAAAFAFDQCAELDVDFAGCAVKARMARALASRKE